MTWSHFLNIVPHSSKSSFLYPPSGLSVECTAEKPESDENPLHRQVTIKLSCRLILSEGSYSMFPGTGPVSARALHGWGWIQNCPFLFRAYQPRQAQKPTTVMVIPSSSATASPPSNAAADGMTARNTSNEYIAAKANDSNVGAMLSVDSVRWLVTTSQMIQCHFLMLRSPRPIDRKSVV